MFSSIIDHLPFVKKSLTSSWRSIRTHVDHLQCPGSSNRFSPEVDGKEGPSIKSLSQSVSGSGKEQG